MLITIFPITRVFLQDFLQEELEDTRWDWSNQALVVQ
jgi:hypothetical protein